MGKIIVPEISWPIKDRNLYAKLLRKSKNDFCNNLNLKRKTENWKFWQTIEPKFYWQDSQRITLAGGHKALKGDKYEVKEFKDYFEKIAETFKIDRPVLSDLNDDPVLNAAENFPTMLMFLKSKKQVTSDCFFFKLVAIENICKQKLSKIILAFFLNFSSKHCYLNINVVFRKVIA